MPRLSRLCKSFYRDIVSFLIFVEVSTPFGGGIQRLPLGSNATDIRLHMGEKNAMHWRDSPRNLEVLNKKLVDEDLFVQD